MLKGIIRRWLFVIACIVTLVALFYAEEDWRGKHAWDTYKRERQAKGESFEWSSVVPPAVPDSENLAATPLFAELFPKPPHLPKLGAIRLPDCPPHAQDPRMGVWRLGRAENLSMWQECFTNTDLLAALSQYGPMLQEITEASRRPYGRFPIRYEDSFAALLPHLNHMRSLARAYRLRALVELSAGQSDAALADVQTILRLADKLNGEPIFISFLVRVAMLDIAGQPIWEGLAAHRWDESQLAALQAPLEKVDQCASVTKMLQGERRFAYYTALWLHSHPTGLFTFLTTSTADLLNDESGIWVDRVIPSGWIDQNELTTDRFYTETVLPALDWEHGRISPENMRQVAHAFDTMRKTPYTVLCKDVLLPITVVAKKAALSQTGVDEAVVACALDRYWLAHGEFPEKLEALTPQFIAKLPHDVINGKPLHYRRTADGQYVLYSMGWNETDDGGQIAMKRVSQDFDQGDWVWFSQPQPQLSASERKQVN